MTEPPLPDKLVEIDAALMDAGIDHAFGGALALAYYAEPRTTVDIDVNVFIAPSDHDRVAAALRPLGVETAVDRVALERDGQARVRWGRTPVDLFYAYDAFHEAMHERVRSVPFGDATIPILAPEDLVVCKAVFARAKDWLDIEQVLLAVPDLDVASTTRWMARLAGDEDTRTERLARLVADVRGGLT
jgi:nucleotidyltransferase AbiEii toxin of type IV toxin-antitoxin system